MKDFLHERVQCFGDDDWLYLIIKMGKQSWGQVLNLDRANEVNVSKLFSLLSEAVALGCQAHQAVFFHVAFQRFP